MDQIISLRLISRADTCGVQVLPGSEYEQRLEISQDGKIHFEAYGYSDGTTCCPHPQSRKADLVLSTEVAALLMRAAASVAAQGEGPAPHSGYWQMNLNFDAGFPIKITAPFAADCGGPTDAFCALARRCLPLPGLMLLDGGV